MGARRSRGAAGGERRAASGEAGWPEDVDIEDDKIQRLFCIYSYRLKGYGPKWHNLTSSGCQISILQIRGPKWHLRTSSRAAGVFNSLFIGWGGRGTKLMQWVQVYAKCIHSLKEKNKEASDK